jgi:NAD(P)-dependent dehydrogenase (short-subunit alcohol dehydrogenase family)
LESKNILLVGGRTGIGKHTLGKLVESGANVTCALRDPSSISFGGVSVCAYDAENPSPLELPDVLDGVVYCPGSITLKPFHRITKADMLSELQVNFLGAFDVLQQSYKALKKGSNPSVVLFSTVAVQTGMGFHASIASAKGAVEGLTRSLAAEWAPKIRVNAIAPSLTDTPLAAHILSSDEKTKAAKMRHPTQTIGDPSDVASTVMFLLGESSKFITGQVLALDGGLSSTKLF